ncbi:MAG: hypothetical protein JSR77_10145 [Planctomycetes bacterium]|nr:hypothetical protein [Planctomycetota bacterium]
MEMTQGNTNRRWLRWAAASALASVAILIPIVATHQPDLKMEGWRLVLGIAILPCVVASLVFAMLANRGCGAGVSGLNASMAGLGLAYIEKPDSETAWQLTDMAWIRDGGARMDEAARRLRLPWVGHGSRNGEEIAVFMVTRACGSVVAVRDDSRRGPVVILHPGRASRVKGQAYWWLIAAILLWVLGSAIERNMHSPMVAWAGPMLEWCALIVGIPQACILVLRGIGRLRTATTADHQGSSMFHGAYSVSDGDRASVDAIFTPRACETIMAQAEHASWWSIGNGWVSCVTAREPYSKITGITMSAKEIGAMIDGVIAVKRALGRA